MTAQQKYKGTADHFTELRRNERNKSNLKHSVDAARGKGKSGKGGNKENVNQEFEDESDDERSSDESEESDIEKYFNISERTPQHDAGSGEASTAMNLNKLLSSRRYATPGMGTNCGVVNPFFSNNVISNSNNTISTSSCSTPTSIYPPVSTSTTTSTNQTKTNKRDLKSYDSNQPSSQPATPKKSNNLSGGESDTSDRCINRFSNRTKLFLTSFLKFRRSLRVKRRNSNSCSDLFVIWKRALEAAALNLFWSFRLFVKLTGGNCLESSNLFCLYCHWDRLILISREESSVFRSFAYKSRWEAGWEEINRGSSL